MSCHSLVLKFREVLSYLINLRAGTPIFKENNKTKSLYQNLYRGSHCVLCIWISLIDCMSCSVTKTAKMRGDSDVEISWWARNIENLEWGSLITSTRFSFIRVKLYMNKNIKWLDAAKCKSLLTLLVGGWKSIWFDFPKDHTKLGKVKKLGVNQIKNGAV